MGVAANQLLAHRIDYVGKIEQSLLLAKLGVEDHLEQQIPQFTLQSFPILGLDGIGHFVGLLQGVGHYGLEALLEIPGAAPVRGAQLSHDVEQLREIVTLGHGMFAFDSFKKGHKAQPATGAGHYLSGIRGAWR
ncbi:hypothetical protein D3C72_474320 [compost metagenome]